MKKADLIFCADVHRLEKNPIARKDNVLKAQDKKMLFLKDLQKEHGCPVLNAGDLFDFWKASPELISKTIDVLPDQFYSIFGDHDIPHKSYKLINKSALMTLVKAGKLTLLDGGHGVDKNNNKLAKNQNPSFEVKGRKIFVWHILTWKDTEPFPGCTNSNAKQLLKKYPQFDVIVTGDNHKPFVEKYKGRILVNTGSLLRLRADQIDYEPAVWLYYAKNNKVKPVYLPIKKDVISREHIEVKKERNERIDAYVEKLDTELDSAELDFEGNLEIFYSKNKVKKAIKKIITKSMSNEKIN